MQLDASFWIPDLLLRVSRLWILCLIISLVCAGILHSAVLLLAFQERRAFSFILHGNANATQCLLFGFCASLPAVAISLRMFTVSGTNFLFFIMCSLFRCNVVFDLFFFTQCREERL
jgi:hypothetical protein